MNMFIYLHVYMQVPATIARNKYVHIFVIKTFSSRLFALYSHFTQLSLHFHVSFLFLFA